MISRRRAVIALAVLLATFAIWTLGRRRSPPPTTPAATSPELALAWASGQRYVYALEWKSHDVATMPAHPAPVSTDLTLAGELVLSSLGRQGRGWALVVTLEHMRRHELKVFGEDILTDDAAAEEALSKQSAVAYVEPSGRIAAIMFRPDGSAVFKSLVQSLLTETAMVIAPAALRPGDVWTAVEPTVHGSARTSYALSPDRGLTRTRTRFETARGFAPEELAASAQHVTSTADERIDQAGHIASFRLRERIEIRAGEGAQALEAEQELDLTLTAVGPFDIATLEATTTAASEERSAGEPSGGTSREDMLAKRAAGLTIEAVIEQLLAHPEGSIPEHSRFLWRTTGLLTLHPELCAKLEPVFADPRLKSDGRQLVLDLVAQAGGTPQSQASLRSMLVTKEATSDARYGLMVQRVSLVPKPNEETLTFAAGLYGDARRTGKTDLGYASAYALGSATGKAMNGTPAEITAARNQNAALRRDLATAAAPKERAALLHAVGNVGLHDNAPAVLSFAHDGDASVRKAVAVALRKDPDAEITHALVGFVRDPSPAVQEASLASLAGRKLPSSELATMAEAVTSGDLAKTNDALAVTLLTEQAPSEARTRVLEAIIARNADRPQVQARAHALGGR